MSASGEDHRSDGTASGRRPADSVTVLTTTVLPADTNSWGNVFGGHVASLIDKAASITASRHCRHNVVTASIDRLDFRAPVRLGDIVTVVARLNYVGRTSMEIGAEVTGEDRISGHRTVACTAFLTFVAMSEYGQPTPVPPLILDDDGDRRRFEEGRQRAVRRREEAAVARRESDDRTRDT